MDQAALVDSPAICSKQGPLPSAVFLKDFQLVRCIEVFYLHLPDPINFLSGAVTTIEEVRSSLAETKRYKAH